MQPGCKREQSEWVYTQFNGVMQEEEPWWQNEK